VTISGISSGLSALRRQSAALDRAADHLAKAASTDVSDAPTSQPNAGAIGAQANGSVDGTVELLVAKRMFSAALKVAQAANEGIGEALRLGDYDSPP
jgi:hypothetical protein